MEALASRVLRHPRIRVHEEHVAIDLITRHKVRGANLARNDRDKRGVDQCLGVYVYDCAADRVVTVASNAVFLATGGLGKVFLYTTNADIATGDGFAMCHRAGLPLANMEFVQFHPSVFYDVAAVQEDERRFLLTEALRGAGAILKLHRDDRRDFMLAHHPHGSNATRDVVTRAQDIEMRRHGLKHLWLDCTSISRTKLLRDFKSSYDYCKSKGFDMAREPIPIIYAAHYSNGGVVTGPSGETAMKGCYVLGETAYTGLHGATRLASNSAPECVLFGRLAARHFSATCKAGGRREQVPLWRVGGAKPLRDKTTVSYYWDTIRRTMSGMCGISRNQERLGAARQVLSSIQQNIREFYWHYRVSRDFLEARNIAEVAMIITESALARRESRACHWREDFAHKDDRRFRRITVARRDRPVTLERIG
jgi:L-aspartate oxidase